MPPSPAEPPEPATILRTLARNWDAALEAILQDDLERAADLLVANEALLAALPGPQQLDAELHELHAAATAAHGRLLAMMRGLQEQTRGELARIRQGRRALAGYAGGPRSVGGRLESRA
jgi:hypothetical protein